MSFDFNDTMILFRLCRVILYLRKKYLRTFLSFDFIVKSFRALNYDVHYVRNITDVDDKIIAKAKSENTSPSAISEKYIQEMHMYCSFINLNLWSS